VPAWMSILNYPSHGSTATVAWSPDGQLIASGSANDPNIVVWDVGTEVPTAMKATPAGITALEWSPSGHYLFVATTACTVLLWETQTWTHREWSGLAAPCKSACWGTSLPQIEETLLFHTWNGKTIHALHLSTLPPRIDAEHYRIQDTSAYAVKIEARTKDYDLNKAQEQSRVVLGAISHMAWDRNGKRLLVAFENQGTHQPAPMRNAVALYAVDTQRKPVRLEPRGFLVGPGDAQGVSTVSFANKFDGALAATCWQNGSISLWPLYCV